jgi:hypothetical protein
VLVEVIVVVDSSVAIMVGEDCSAEVVEVASASLTALEVEVVYSVGVVRALVVYPVVVPVPVLAGAGRAAAEKDLMFQIY